MSLRSVLRKGATVAMLTALCLALANTAPVWVPAAAAQVTPIDDEPGNEAPGLGNIIGSPDAGPDPEDLGDRGGWAQLGLAGLLLGAVLFIGSRILAESRRGRAAAAPGVDPPSPDAL